MELIIEGDEARLLRQVLTQYLSTLREEIGKTENYEWRQSEKQDEATLKDIIGRLDQALDDAESPEVLPPARELEAMTALQAETTEV